MCILFEQRVESMKKFLSILISFIIAFTSMANGMVAFASEVNNKNLHDFADDLISMVRQHEANTIDDTDTSVDNFYSSANEQFFEKYPELSPNAFGSKRLVVKSKYLIDFQGAVDHVSGYRNLYILQYDTLENVQKAYDYYRSLDYIDYVEPDYVMRMQGVLSSEDIQDSVSDVVDDVKDFIENQIEESPTYEVRDEPLSWASEKIGFEAIKDELAQNIKDDFVQVAILDSGVDTDHELFEGRLLESDINFSSTGDENSCEDDFGHGTHVTGVVVDNTLSNVKIKPYKVLNSSGKGNESLISIAIDLAVAEGADVINLSLSSDGVFQTMIDSINNATEKGVNVVVAAGNDKKDLSNHYVSPASIESAITVSAITNRNELSSYSNYNGTIDIAAPGDDIKSSYLNNKYVELSGTSMAAPQVAAGLAIIYSLYPDKTAEEAEEMIKEYAILMPENEGENKFGAGILYLKYIMQDKPKTSDPVFSRESCTFSNSFTLTITCPEPTAKIYYLTSDDEKWINANLYSKSITVSLDTTIYAIAIVDGKKFSSIVKMEYVRANNTEEDMYDINNSGYISGYWGSEVDLVIPQTIRGKTVKGIAPSAFLDNSDIRSVTLPSTATRIYNEAFKGCDSLEYVIGSNVTQVDKEAFKDSSISNFSFNNVTTYGISAFENCKNLQNVILTNAITIQSSAFKNASGISIVSSDKITTIGTSAFEGTDIEQVDVPSVTTLSSYAFKDCEKLVSALIPQVKTISGGAFQNCVALKEIEMLFADSVGASAFRNTGLEHVYCYSAKTLGNFAFAENELLAFVSLPKVTTIGTYAFQDCPELQVVNMPVLKILTNDSFSDCPKLLQLRLPSVETVNKGALDNSSLEYIQFDVVKTVKSLPETLKGFVAPSSLTTIDVNVPKNDFVIYGYEGTYAQTFAIENNKEFCTVPAIIYDLKDQVDPDDTFIMVYALGFNCEYQWYRNDEVSNIGGRAIEGATNYYYAPDDLDVSKAFYCVITSSDGVNTNSITTKPIKNSFDIDEIDLSEYFEIIDNISSLDRNKYKEEELQSLDELISIDISKFTTSQQEELDSLVEKIKAEYESLTVPKLLGDVNDDGVVSAIDARIVLRFVAGLSDLLGREIVTGDMDEDGVLTSVDARYILQKSVGII